jgi:DNA replication protein DnaC
VKSIGQETSEQEPEDKFCDKHGVWMKGIIFPLFNDPIYNCKECDAEREEEEARLDEERRENARKMSIKKLFESCQIGPRFHGIEFDSYEPENEKARKVKDRCVEFSVLFGSQAGITGGGLIMLGRPGTGKNHLAAAICTELMNNGYSCLHTSAIKLVRRIKETWSHDNAESESVVVKSFLSPDLLVVDEVGVQFGSPTEQLYITEIINDRYEYRKPTILISNLTMKELGEVLGERVIDRFHDNGQVLVFDWESYRRKR